MNANCFSKNEYFSVKKRNNQINNVYNIYRKEDILMNNDDIEEESINKNESAENGQENIVLLVTALNDTEEMIFEGILEGNGIPFLKKKRETGGIMEIYMGFSLYGSDYYVEESLLDEATSLLEAYTSGLSSAEEEPPEETKDEEDSN